MKDLFLDSDNIYDGVKNDSESIKLIEKVYIPGIKKYMKEDKTERYQTFINFKLIWMKFNVVLPYLEKQSNYKTDQIEIYKASFELCKYFITEIKLKNY